jgi:hypothetical protein
MKFRTIAFMTIGTLSLVQAGPVGHAAVRNPALIAGVRIAAQPQALNYDLHISGKPTCECGQITC